MVHYFTIQYITVLLYYITFSIVDWILVILLLAFFDVQFED